MSFTDWLSAWANVPFAIAGAATLLFAAVQASGLLGVLANGADADGDADGDADADGADTDAGADPDTADGAADAGVDADAADGGAGADGVVDADTADGAADAGIDADAAGGHADAVGDADTNGDTSADDHAPTLAASVLGPLMIGRVPLTLTLEVFGIAFSTAGYVANAAWITQGAVPLISLAWTLPLGVLSGYASSALLARIVAPIVDDRRHAATSRRELVGTIGVVISSKVSDAFGEIRIRDRSGHDVRVVCRLAPRCRVLDEREEAVVVDVDERGTLFVAPLDAPR